MCPSCNINVKPQRGIEHLQTFGLQYRVTFLNAILPTSNCQTVAELILKDAIILSRVVGKLFVIIIQDNSHWEALALWGSHLTCVRNRFFQSDFRRYTDFLYCKTWKKIVMLNCSNVLLSKIVGVKFGSPTEYFNKQVFNKAIPYLSRYKSSSVHRIHAVPIWLTV